MHLRTPGSILLFRFMESFGPVHRSATGALFLGLTLGFLEVDLAPGVQTQGKAIPEPGLCMNSLGPTQCAGGRPVPPAPRGPGVSGTNLAVTSLHSSERTHHTGPHRHYPLLRPRAAICALPKSPQQADHGHTAPLGEVFLVFLQPRPDPGPSPPPAFPRTAISEYPKNLMRNEDLHLSPLTLEFPRDGARDSAVGEQLRGLYAHQRLVLGAILWSPPAAGSAPRPHCQNAETSSCLKTGHPPSIPSLPVPFLLATLLP